jgi:DNA-binding transcriptional LysR family regulator
MELFQARYFVTVADELSFRRAAENLHVSSSSLSVQIRKLELEIGADVFIREGHTIKLTDVGRVFLKEARQILIQAERSVTMARQAATGELALSIGYNTVAEFDAVPRIIPAFKKQWPSAQLTLRSLRTPEQFEALRSNELDLGFICPPIPTEGFDVQELTREPFVAVLSAGHRLAAASSINFEDLSGEPLILYSRISDPDSFRQIEQHFADARAVMNVVYELESSFAMINFVAMGNGCSIVPEYAAGILRDGTVCRPLGPPSIMRTLAVAKRKDSGILAESFYRFAVEQFAPLAPLEALDHASIPAIAGAG